MEESLHNLIFWDLKSFAMGDSLDFAMDNGLINMWLSGALLVIALFILRIIACENAKILLFLFLLIISSLNSCIFYER